MGLAQFFQNNLERRFFVFVSKCLECTNDRIDHRSLRTVYFNDSSKRFNYSNILRICVCFTFKRSTFFYKNIKNFKSTNFGFDLLSVSHHPIQNTDKMRKKKICTKCFSS